MRCIPSISEFTYSPPKLVKLAKPIETLPVENEVSANEASLPDKVSFIIILSEAEAKLTITFCDTTSADVDIKA